MRRRGARLLDRGAARAAQVAHATLLKACARWGVVARRRAGQQRTEAEAARWHRRRGEARALRRWAAASSGASVLLRHLVATGQRQWHARLATGAALRRWRHAAAHASHLRLLETALGRRPLRHAVWLWAARSQEAVLLWRAAGVAATAALRRGLARLAAASGDEGGGSGREWPGWAEAAAEADAFHLSVALRRWASSAQGRPAARLRLVERRSIVFVRWRLRWREGRLDGAAWRSAGAHAVQRRRRLAFWALWQSALVRAAALGQSRRAEARRCASNTLIQPRPFLTPSAYHRAFAFARQAALRHRWLRVAMTLWARRRLLRSVEERQVHTRTRSRARAAWRRWRSWAAARRALALATARGTLFVRRRAAAALGAWRVRARAMRYAAAAFGFGQGRQLRAALLRWEGNAAAWRAESLAAAVAARRSAAELGQRLRWWRAEAAARLRALAAREQAWVLPLVSAWRRWRVTAATRRALRCRHEKVASRSAYAAAMSIAAVTDENIELRANVERLRAALKEQPRRPAPQQPQPRPQPPLWPQPPPPQRLQRLEMPLPARLSPFASQAWPLPQLDRREAERSQWAQRCRSMRVRRESLAQDLRAFESCFKDKQVPPGPGSRESPLPFMMLDPLVTRTERHPW